ncbi:MAG: twin-arginine translocation signal domain-containing protein [Deltaproteobacteria bacterium]|nr:twin-arginine translocation signal domain-containing protein [Deltaproteobacteria bacterium]MBN2670659.1 twin-arginine translocation signal domain-containing protein [Deltaproteobacteria bacterium]
MKKSKFENRQGASSRAEGSETNRVSRRRFLQISGGAAAAAAVGTTLYLLNEESSDSTLNRETDVSTAAQTASHRSEMPQLSPEEAIAMRRLRQRRQFLDGTSDSILGANEPWERDCIQSFIAHQL